MRLGIWHFNQPSLSHNVINDSQFAFFCYRASPTNLFLFSLQSRCFSRNNGRIKGLTALEKEVHNSFQACLSCRIYLPSNTIKRAYSFRKIRSLIHNAMLLQTVLLLKKMDWPRPNDQYIFKGWCIYPLGKWEE